MLLCVGFSLLNSFDMRFSVAMFSSHKGRWNLGN